MLVTYTIELDNAVIGVKETIAKVHCKKGPDEEWERVFMLNKVLDNNDDLRSSNVLEAVMETIGRIPKTDAAKRKVTRRKADAEE